MITAVSAHPVAEGAFVDTELLSHAAIGRDVSITIFTASSLNSGEKLFFGRGNYFTFPDNHPNGWTVRKPRGTPAAVPCCCCFRGRGAAGASGSALGPVTRVSFLWCLLCLAYGGPSPLLSLLLPCRRVRPGRVRQRSAPAFLRMFPVADSALAMWSQLGRPLDDQLARRPGWAVIVTHPYGSKPGKLGVTGVPPLRLGSQFGGPLDHQASARVGCLPFGVARPYRVMAPLPTLLPG